MPPYDPQAPIPPLPREDKRRIGKALFEICYDDNMYFCPMEGAMRRFFATLSKEEIAYAKFWLGREQYDPGWRADDKTRRLPEDHNAKILEFKPKED